MTTRTATTRRRLQAAALDLYAERGYAASTVAAVAERGGVTERTFFRHFADKAEVLFADGIDLADAIRAAAARRDGDIEGDPWAPAERALLALAPMLQERESELRLQQAVIAANPELVARETVKRESLVSVLDATMREEGIEPARAALAAAVALAVFRVAYSSWLTDESGEPFAERIVRCLEDLGGSGRMPNAAPGRR